MNENYEKKEKKGLKIFIIILLILLVGILMFILGQYASNKMNINMFKDETKTEVKDNSNKKDNDSEVSNKYSGKTFYADSKKDRNIKFISNKEYEYQYKLRERVISIKGVYEVKDNEISFDDYSMKAKIYSNYFELDDNSDPDDPRNYLFFLDDDFSKEEKKVAKSVDEYIKSLKNKDKNLPNVTDTKVDKLECFNYKNSKDDNKFVCSIDYSVYVENFDENKCGDMTYFAYTGSSGGCKDSHIFGWSFFEINKNNDTYKVISTYTGL